MQSQSQMSSQKFCAENLSRITTEPPLTSTRAGRHHAADRVIHRQAIVHAVVGAGVHQAGEPEAPLHQPMVADIGGLRQAGGARGVDQQRAVGDGRAAALGSRQRLGRMSLDLAIDAGKFAVRRRRRATRSSAAWIRCAAAERNRPHSSAATMRCLGADDVDAMGERRAAQIGVDERDDAADGGDAEPDRHVFGAVRHQQRRRFRPCRDFAPAPSARSGWRARQARDRSGARAPRAGQGRRRAMPRAPR